MLRSKADGRVDLVKLYKTLLDIAAGMQYLHSANILHGAVLQGHEDEHGVLMTDCKCSCRGTFHSLLACWIAGDLKLGNILLKSTATDLRGALALHMIAAAVCSGAQVTAGWLAGSHSSNWTLVCYRLHCQDLRLWHEPADGRQQDTCVDIVNGHHQLPAAGAAVGPRCVAGRVAVASLLDS